MTCRSKIVLVLVTLIAAGVVFSCITPTPNTLHPLPFYYEGIPEDHILAPQDRRTMSLTLTNIGDVTTVYIPPNCQGACTIMCYRSDLKLTSQTFVITGGGLLNSHKADKIYIWKNHKETEVFIWTK